MIGPHREVYCAKIYFCFIAHEKFKRESFLRLEGTLKGTILCY